jgi:NAD(P)-dependent dehydrogenase (short-subunit alcohol dehydrogenase family)
MPDSLASKTVVITHGAHGIGPTIARRFGRAQARVVIADQDHHAAAVTAGELQEEGFTASYALVDVAHPQTSYSFVDELVQQVGPIKVWINALPPSLLGGTRPTTGVWEESLSILSTAFYCSEAIAKYMHQAGGGVIVNLTTVAGYHPGDGQVAESVVAAGLIAMTRALGIDWAAKAVRVVGIAVSTSPAEQRRIPMHRNGSAEEVAEAAFFIASDEASYIVAETLPVDGGWSAYQMF